MKDSTTWLHLHSGHPSTTSYGASVVFSQQSPQSMQEMASPLLL
ncbi:unnamed protein product [Linum tenue]|uniref:Uncharacterized protein n=1 Tax=Linum tenue TaxID=586396 RepID=A0AAV0N4Z1_9ROSI|nr:unnamed protein product [Linum tenue]